MTERPLRSGMYRVRLSVITLECLGEENLGVQDVVESVMRRVEVHVETITNADETLREQEDLFS